MKTLIRKQYPVWNEFPNLFEDMLGDWAGGSVRNRMPAVNVKESDEEFSLELAAPGFKREDFNVNVEDDRLSISTEQKREEQSSEENYTRKEFSYFAFERSFRLPKGMINLDGIEAKYEDGVLRISLPKLNEAKNKAVKNILIG